MFEFLVPFGLIAHSIQVSTPSFGSLNSMYLLKSMKQFFLEFVLVLLNWGVVRDGLRPMVRSRVIEHNFVNIVYGTDLGIGGCHC